MRTITRIATLFAGIVGLLPSTVFGQAAYEIGPTPPWVKQIPLVVTDPLPPSEVSEGYEVLLVDKQDRVFSADVETFSHVAYRLIDEGAVQDRSQIEIVFDPSYQDLILHAATVTRNGRSIDQLKPDRIRVMQRETRLEFQTYDGSLSVVLLLEDVRRGDLVEYSYTRLGSNPVFAGRYMRTFTLKGTVPLRRLHFRLLWPRDRPLHVRRYETDLKPAIQRMGRYTEYVWDRADVPPRFVDTSVPRWYQPFPQIQLSEFETWSEVAAWGDSLFHRDQPLPSGLSSTLAKMREASRSTADRVQAALRFVQDEVRYLGIEIGVNSHVPHSPATVIARRYGDCKDKSLLLITMLRELGVKARPALVSSTYAGHIADFHPTAEIFDHAIVQAIVDGEEYWLDPTSMYQRGDLRALAPSYGAALVLGPSVISLSAIPESKPTQPFTDISVQFQLREVGDPADVRVETWHRGSLADGVRASLRNTSVEQLQRGYLEFYADIYPSIESQAPLQVDDDETANLIWTAEEYSVPEFWYSSDDYDGYIGDFYPLELASVIPSPTTVNRSMPLRVSHPTHIRYTIEARLKEGWQIDPEHVTIETPAVRFYFRARAKNELLTLTYEYETLADHVAPEDAPEHIEKMSRARDLLMYNVTSPGATDAFVAWWEPRELNWLVLLTAIFISSIAVLASVRIYGLQPVSWPHGPGLEFDGPRGLGGWLILVGFGVTVLPIVMVTGFVDILPSYAASTWSQYTTPDSGLYHPLWAPLLIFELVVNVALIVFSVLQVWAFYRRKRVFPGLFVVLTGTRVVTTWVDSVLADAIPALEGVAEAGTGQLLWAVVMAAIWIAYMFRSRRVQNTFVT
jgi:transglutaminase-like putative cysteine protease